MRSVGESNATLRNCRGYFTHKFSYIFAILQDLGLFRNIDTIPYTHLESPVLRLDIHHSPLELVEEHSRFH